MCLCREINCVVSAGTRGWNCDLRLIIVRQNISFCALLPDVTKYSCKRNNEAM